MKRSEPVSYKCFYVHNVAECCDLHEDYIGYINDKVNVLFIVTITTIKLGEKYFHLLLIRSIV